MGRGPFPILQDLPIESQRSLEERVGKEEEESHVIYLWSFRPNDVVGRQGNIRFHYMPILRRN